MNCPCIDRIFDFVFSHHCFQETLTSFFCNHKMFSHFRGWLESSQVWLKEVSPREGWVTEKTKGNNCYEDVINFKQTLHLAVVTASYSQHLDRVTPLSHGTRISGLISIIQISSLNKIQKRKINWILFLARATWISRPLLVILRWCDGVFRAHKDGERWRCRSETAVSSTDARNVMCHWPPPALL